MHGTPRVTKAAEVIALLPYDADCIELVGGGALADELRALLATRCLAKDAGRRPATIIELTGKNDSIRSALQRVGDLGTVVLAGHVPSAPLALDLYADVHVRGLTIIGYPLSGAPKSQK